MGALGQRAGERVPRVRPHRVPPHVRHAQALAAEPDDLAGQPAEAVDVALGAVLEQHLQADADAEERHALAADAAVEVLDPAALAQRGHRDVGGPDAREDEAVDASGASASSGVATSRASRPRWCSAKRTLCALPVW